MKLKNNYKNRMVMDEEEGINSLSTEDAVEIYNLMLDYFAERKYTTKAFITFLSSIFILTLEFNNVPFEVMEELIEHLMNEFKEMRKKRSQRDYIR
jgi:hypothetical protein